MLKSMLCGAAWDRFKKWVSVDWTQTTFIIVICVFAVLGLFAFLSFFKGSFDKGKKPKWLLLVVALLMFGAMALLTSVRFV